MGRICSGCHQDLSKSKFSTKQWAASQEQRRCKDCTKNNVPSRPLPETQDEAGTSAQQSKKNKTVILREPIDYIDEDYARQKLEPFPDDISCWICLEEKDLSSASRPLLRDCCCRGDHQGWAHYECLAHYSSTRIDSEFEMASTRGMNAGDFEGMWTQCPTCQHSYENDLGLALSAGWVKYVEEKEIVDAQMKNFLRLETHMSLMLGLKGAVHLDDSHIDELEQVANTIIKQLLPKVKKSTLLPQQHKLEVEADVRRLGLSYFAEENGDYDAALEHQKRAHELFGLLESGAIELLYEQDYEAKIAQVQYDIDRLHKILEEKEEEEDEGGCACCEDEVDEVELEKSRRLYELSMRDDGEFSSSALSSGIKYADLLYISSVVKSERLATKLFENSKRIFGPGHHVTEQAERTYERTRHRGVSVPHPDHGMLKFDVIGFNAKEDCYVLKLPDFVDDDDDRYAEMRVKAVIAPRLLCLLVESVPVVVFGLPPGPLEHLNGKIGETKSILFSEDSNLPNFVTDYTIQFEDNSLEDNAVPPSCILMLLHLPPEDANIVINHMPGPDEVDAKDKK